MFDPNSYVPGESPSLDFVYNNESDFEEFYWPVYYTKYKYNKDARILYNDNSSDYFTYSGGWNSLLVTREKDGRYKNITMRAYSGDSFYFYLEAGSLADGIPTYYSGPLTTSGNYSVLTTYSGEQSAINNKVLFTAPSGNSMVYTFSGVNVVNYIRLHHMEAASGQEYRMYQFLPRTLIQVDDLEADVIDAVTIRVSDSIVIGPDMIGDKTILGQKIVDGTVSGILLTNGTITGSKIQANTISGALITAGTITGDKITAATISGSLITAGAITADKLNVTKLEAVSANTGDLNVNGTLTVTSGVITAGLTRIDSNGIDIDSTGLVGLNDSLRIIGSGATGGITGMSWYNRHYSSVNPVAAMGLDSVNVLSISMPRVGTGNVIQLDFDNTYGGQVKILDGGLDIVKGDLYVYNSTGTSIVSHIKNTGEGKFTSVISPVFLTQTTGSAGSPTYVTTDPDSGMYGPADGIIAFSTNSVEALRINNFQQLLLSNGGVSTPSMSFINDQDTGFYRVEPNAIRLACSGVWSAYFDQNRIMIPDGSIGTPGLSFINDQDTGFYKVEPNAVRLSCGGVWSAYFDATRIMIPDGTVGTPGLSFINDQDTGFYKAEADAIRISTGNNFTGLFSTNQLQMAVGTEALPSYTFVNDNDTGMFRSSANAVALTAGGTQILTAASAGQVLISTANSNGQLTIEVPNGTARTLTTWRQLNDASAYINFVCNTITASTPIQTSALGTYYGKARVQVNGTVRWIALYNT